jgi:hypothetical protein
METYRSSVRRIEIHPPPDAAGARAVATALTGAGISSGAAPDAYASAWSRAARAEAVERGEPIPYAPSPRRTRGAERA